MLPQASGLIDAEVNMSSVVACAAMQLVLLGGTHPQAGDAAGGEQGGRGRAWLELGLHMALSCQLGCSIYASVGWLCFQMH
jgi:hypothetical protein